MLDTIRKHLECMLRGKRIYVPLKSMQFTKGIGKLAETAKLGGQALNVVESRKVFKSRCTCAPSLKLRVLASDIFDLH